MAASAGSTGSTEVTIGGRRFRLRGEDPKLLRRLAREVDETIRALAGGGAADDPRVAVLAALNFAGDRDELEARAKGAAEEIRRRAAALRRRLERLREAGVPSS
ncbi:MAG: cell division protein ZapA [Acidobacteria bacterium]|nr:MAG: cell division protein ZapA [Acidobacteriota bacterium]